MARASLELGGCVEAWLQLLGSGLVWSCSEYVWLAGLSCVLLGDWVMVARWLGLVWLVMARLLPKFNITTIMRSSP